MNFKKIVNTSFKYPENENVKKWKEKCFKAVAVKNCIMLDEKVICVVVYSKLFKAL